MSELNDTREFFTQRIRKQADNLRVLADDIEKFIDEDNAKYGTPDTETRWWLKLGQRQLKGGLELLELAVNPLAPNEPVNPPVSDAAAAATLDEVI